MMVDARRSACEVDQLLQQSLGLGRAHARNVVGVPAYEEGLASGLRMNLNERAQRNRTVVEAVAAVVAAFLGLMPQLGLAVVKRVMCRELFHLRAKVVIEGIVCRSHVGPSGLAARDRH